MITMLYEKMLTRKVVGLQEVRSEADTESEPDPDDTVKDTKRSEQKVDQGKQSASMGKVLNLMRYVGSSFPRSRR